MPSSGERRAIIIGVRNFGKRLNGARNETVKGGEPAVIEGTGGASTEGTRCWGGNYLAVGPQVALLGIGRQESNFRNCKTPTTN